MNTSVTASDIPKTFGRKIASYLILSSGFAFIALLVYLSWDKLLFVFESVHWPLFIASIFFFLGGNLIASFFFHDLLEKYSIKVNFKSIIKIFFYGQIAKYVPGRVWALFYQMASLRTPGGASALFFSNIDIMASTIVANTAIAVGIILFGVNVAYGLGVFFAGMVVYYITVRSCLIHRVIAPVLAKFKHKAVTPVTCKSHFHRGKLVLYYLSNWILPLGAFFMMLHASFDFSPAQSSGYIAYLYLAWIASIVAFFIPAGLGIKELVFILLAKYLSADVTLDTLAAIAVISRFWNVLIDLIGAVFIFLWKKLQND